VRICKDRAFRDCALASTGHAELEPVTDGLGDGAAVALGDLAIFVIADDLTQDEGQLLDRPPDQSRLQANRSYRVWQANTSRRSAADSKPQEVAEREGRKLRIKDPERGPFLTCYN
jgi:hypothetical protein